MVIFQVFGIIKSKKLVMLHSHVLWSIVNDVDGVSLNQVSLYFKWISKKIITYVTQVGLKK